MSRTRPTRNLYFQFVRGTDLDGLMHAEEIRDCLNDAGLIVLFANGRSYAETARMKELSKIELIKVLSSYFLTARKEQGVSK